MENPPRYRINEWLKVYLIFGAASFLLGFAGYLTARPQGIAARFAERWSDLTGRLPVAGDLKWLESPAVPTFSSRKLPVILLTVFPETGGKTAGVYAMIKNRLQKLSFNVLSIPISTTDDWQSAIQNSPTFYRKYILFGIRHQTAQTSPDSGYAMEMVIEANPFLSVQLFPALAAELAKQQEPFAWEQTDDSEKGCISIEWNDTQEMSNTLYMAELCVKVLEKARSGLSADYQI